jgi:multiple sugar transport system permease protein
VEKNLAKANPNLVIHSRKKRINRSKMNDYIWAYCFIAPTLIGLGIFYIWPVFQTLHFSFTKWGDFGGHTWTGLQNYKQLFSDGEVWVATRNTFIYTFLTVPISIIISMVVAVLLNQKIKAVGLYRTLFFLPVVTMPVAVAMVWSWLLNSRYGLINYILGLFSIKGPDWLTNPNLALYSIIIVGIWSAIGTQMVIFLSGLQGIPTTYYEAAKIDGASPFTQFFRITLPMLTPVIFFELVISLIGAFQVFDLIFLMINQNSVTMQHTETLVYLFYQHSFVTNDKGYGAAIAMLLFFIVLIFTVLQVLFQKKWVHYQ